MNLQQLQIAQPSSGRRQQEQTPASGNLEQADKRTAPRLSAADVPAITGIRLMPDDVQASLVNISAAGILVECTARRRPGTSVTVQFLGVSMPPTAGRVARALVAYLGNDGALRYHLGIAFNTPVSLDAVVASNRDEPVSSPTGQNLQPAPERATPRRNRW